MDLDGSISLRDRRNAASGNTKIYLQSLVDRAVQLFRDGDYKAALGFLNQAIEQDSDAPSAVIDKRAATFIKLQNLDAALTDASRIVRTHKENAIGYLRLSQVLQLQSKPEKARRVYERALRWVPTADPHFKTLQLSQDQLVRKLSPPKASDPLQLLPRELAAILFSYLHFRDIVNISRVSRGWRNCVTPIPELWQDLDFSSSKKPVPFKALKAVVKLSQGRVRRYSTPRSCIDLRSQLLYVADRCKVLQELQFGGPYAGETLLAGIPFMSNLTKLVVAPHSQIMLNNCSEIFQKCPRLENAEFHRILDSQPLELDWGITLPSSLRSLLMIADSEANFRPLFRSAKRLLDRAPNMERLTLRNWTIDPGCLDQPSEQSDTAPLKYLDLTSSHLATFPDFPSTLQTLIIDDTNIEMDPSQPVILKQLPNLIRLSISGVRMGIDVGIKLRQILAANQSNLLELNLSHTDLQLDDLIELTQAKYLESVEKLVIRQCYVNDELAALIARHCKRLRYLDVAHTNITGVGVKGLLTNLKPHLESLGLDSCRSVSPDAVEWARGQGLSVSYRFPENLLKGKKVFH